MFSKILRFAVGAAICAALIAPSIVRADAPRGFTSLFDGKTLNGWKLMGGTGPGYVVRDGMIVCPKDGGGNLFTEKEYSDFVFRCEFKLEKAGNKRVSFIIDRGVTSIVDIFNFCVKTSRSSHPQLNVTITKLKLRRD